MGIVKFDGTARLKAALKDMKKLENVKKAVLLNGTELQQKAMQKAPVETGYLKRSITLSIKDDGMTAEVRAGASYAPYQEYGTRFIDAHPFMKPSLTEQGPVFINDIEKAVK